MASPVSSGVSISSRARGMERRARGRGIPRKCRCGEASIIRTSETDQNSGRLFYCCPFGSKEDNFHLFKWTDVAMVEEMESLERVVDKIESEMRKLEKGVACDMESLACETRTCEEVANSYGNKIESLKVLVKGCEMEIEAVKAMVTCCEKEMHEF